jgi:hypothetical protein
METLEISQAISIKMAFKLPRLQDLLVQDDNIPLSHNNRGPKVAM